MVYEPPQAIAEADLALMRRIDELHVEHPFAGSCMLCTPCTVFASHWPCAPIVAQAMHALLTP